MSEKISSNENLPDKEIVDIVNYVLDYKVESQEAYDTARLCLMDSIGCAITALQFSECTKLLGPVIQDIKVPNGSRVPGTLYELDPITAAFNIGLLIRWLDYNDTWLAAEWGHPSDNLGAILAVSDYISRKNVAEGMKPLKVHDVLTAMIKAHEIQGIMALENSFNEKGIDHVILVKLASTAVASSLLNCTKTQMINAISNVWIDLGPLRTYRHWPNTGSRKSWAAGDATSRAVFLALLAKKGEMGYPTALTTPKWGFYARIWNGEQFKFQRPYGSYVMENVLFKVSFPAEFHGQTAVEASIKLHPKVKDQLDQIEKIQINTQQAGNQIINKIGPLKNPADRDHCIQYMTAIGLIFGNLEAEDYEDKRALNPMIDELRSKMEVRENLQYIIDYHDPSKRSVANSVQVFFKDGTTTKKETVEYPIGHKFRRKEAVPLLIEKFKKNMKIKFSPLQISYLVDIFRNQKDLELMPVNEFMERFQIK
ncbi:MAG: bifunctional 2-methylcitrate dehydratase/aconitate hydratase [Promethearchaeota archaeon]